MPIKLTALRARNGLTKMRHVLVGEPRSTFRWLFLATLPNSGSTAFAQVLETAPGISTAEPRGEAQWLVPQMSQKGLRWDPDLELDYRLIRAVWLRHAVRRSHGSAIVLEKSPANIVRMPALLETFSDMRPAVIVFTRDPVAICASWARRYDPQTLAARWLSPGTPAPRDDREFHQTLGRLCGERLAHLAGLQDLSSTVVTYEALTADPDAVSERLASLFPEAGPMSFSGEVSVKEYASQPLHNMNAEQISRLTPEQQGWIREGLEGHRRDVERLGYTLE